MGVAEYKRTENVHDCGGSAANWSLLRSNFRLGFQHTPNRCVDLIKYKSNVSAIKYLYTYAI